MVIRLSSDVIGIWKLFILWERVMATERLLRMKYQKSWMSVMASLLGDVSTRYVANF